MENQSTQQTIIQYVNLIKRGKYFLIVPIVASLIIGCAVAFKLPPVYRSDAKLFYIETQMPEWAKQLDVVNIYLEAMFIFIEAMTFTGDNCVKAINELNLYPNLFGKVPMAELIQLLKDNYEKKPI